MSAAHGRRGARNPSIRRRIGLSPRERGCLAGDTCPDIFELHDGDFAVMGTDRTDTLQSLLPPEDERPDRPRRIVVVPRQVLLSSKSDIPDA
nr:hypothetical protein [Streptomyces sp. CC224B]